MRIGIFDSGIGGLTVLKSLLDKFPNNEYIYFGDTINLPYGNKTKNQLLNLARNNINFLLEKNVGIIVVACGTISSNIYDQIKNDYNVPLIDIITPTVKELKGFKKVGLLATEMTIKSEVFKHKIEKNNIQVIDVACPKFVPLIEGKLKENKEKIVEETLKELKNQNIEIFIPGCTHYPLLKKEIEKYLNIKMFDLGGAIAKNISILDSQRSIELYFSQITDELKINIKKIIGELKINKI